MRVILPILALCGACRTTLTTDAVPGDDPVDNWETRLGEIVTDKGYVDYDNLEADRSALDAYVAWLASDEAWEGRARKNRHALYLNAYNALVIFQILERGRPDSVLDVDGWIPVPGSGFFLETQFEMGPTPLSLAEIEHERIRMKFMDYRDHAAMNCGSMSCPPLRDELYTQARINDQLDDQMKRWMGDTERGVRFEDGSPVFSPIFSWFKRDFSFWTAGKDWCTLAAQYAPRPMKRRLDRHAENGCESTTFDYDWSLNHASVKP